MSKKQFKALVLSVVKHSYVALAVDSHPQFDLVAVCDDPHEPDWVHERNQEFADRFEIPYIRDLDQAVKDYDPDLAVVSSQAERHCDLSVRAAAAGLHVIVDKPLSTKLSECDRLVQAVKTSGVRCLVWNRNFLPALCQATQALKNGAIGDLRAIHCDFYFSKDAGPRKGTREPGYPPINWLQRQIEAHADGSDGGVGVVAMGELQIEGIYPLAYIRMLAGSSVKRVFARTAAHFHQANADNDVDDLATVTLEMETGVAGSLCIGRIGAASHPDIGEIKLHLLGTEGALVVSESRPEIAVHYRGQPANEFRHIRVADDNNYLLMENFAHAIEHGTDTILDAQGGRDICATVDACVRSGKTGQLETVS
ncbi:MAG: Gfo/Idh/MocA family oxidoreductase [Fuerstiella sp.]|nr:Gfo/Idh/MocA family oxidoreductase [Fuerstiella sp.]